MRHVSPQYGGFHPTLDDCAGSDVYGLFDGDAQSFSSWSIEFNNIKFNQFLFAYGDCSTWLVTSKFEAIGEYYGSAGNRCIFNSSETDRNPPYSASWRYRDDWPEEPWIGTSDMGVLSKIVRIKNCPSDNF